MEIVFCWHTHDKHWALSVHNATKHTIQIMLQIWCGCHFSRYSNQYASAKWARQICRKWFSISQQSNCFCANFLNFPKVNKYYWCVKICVSPMATCQNNYHIYLCPKHLIQLHEFARREHMAMWRHLSIQCRLICFKCSAVTRIHLESNSVDKFVSRACFDMFAACWNSIIYFCKDYNH